MTLAAPCHAPLPRLSFRDWLRRELSPLLALLADARHYLFAPLPPLPPIRVTFDMGTVPRTPGFPWETVIAEFEAAGQVPRD